MMNNKAVSILELLVVLALIGILSTIMIPVYNDYVHKAKMTEALSMLDTYKAQAEDHYLNNTTWTGFPTGDLDTFSHDYLTKVVSYWVGNEIYLAIEFDPAGLDIDPLTVPTPRLLLYSKIDPTVDTLEWQCGYDNRAAYKIPPEKLPTSCNQQVFPW